MSGHLFEGTGNPWNMGFPSGRSLRKLVHRWRKTFWQNAVSRLTISRNAANPPDLPQIRLRVQTEFEIRNARL